MKRITSFPFLPTCEAGFGVGGVGENLRILKARVLEIGLSSLDRTWQEGRNYYCPRAESKTDVPQEENTNTGCEVSSQGEG